MRVCKLNNGFTLVEMAIVLVIIGLLLGSILSPLSAQMNQRNYAETRNNMDEAREAIIAYGMSRGYLPCPAISYQNGAEDRSTTGSCIKRVGFLPWAALGIAKLDSWGHLYKYSVTSRYANDKSKINITSIGDIVIQTRTAAGAIINLTNEDTVPASIMSFGQHAQGATSDDGVVVVATSTTNVDEEANATTTGAIFIARNMNQNATISGGEFDDLVLWLSPYIYLNRMVSVGQLP